MSIITIQSNSGVPKYRQIIRSVEKKISEGMLHRDARLPSVNKICLEFSVSRDTVLLAYEELKKRGIIYAIAGKGYYVKSTAVAIEQKIFLLFDELNAFKEDVYNAFLETVGENVHVDIFFHHFNIAMFTRLVTQSNGHYTKYVIMPTNLSGAAAAIKVLPTNEVYILDQTNPALSQYPAVYQNFVTDIDKCLREGGPLIDKYRKMVMIFPGFREPLGMKDGFVNFCVANCIPYEVITAFEGRDIAKGEVYIIPNDRDLVSVIEKSKHQELALGCDFGIISYNETPLKRIAADGITTISTDFDAMGRIIALMVISDSKAQVENKCALIIRNSL